MNDLDLTACCNASEKALGLTPFDEQLIAAKALYSGKIVEMKTGEGKTLSAVFAAYLLKLDGRRVHIFTFNDYLAKRDYNWMKPVYDLLGVSVGLITESTPFAQRRAAYREFDVIYSTVKECGFDFLRDFMAFDAADEAHSSASKGAAFDFAIFDEADSVLIDEAKIPLVIAGDVDALVSEDFTKAFDFVKGFSDKDYGINHETMSAFLTDSGTEKTEKFFSTDNLYNEENIELRCNIETCLKALFYLQENKDYVVKDGAIKLIDALSGRIAQHRLFPGALQTAVEAKHGLKVTERGVVTGMVPIQFFARQYKDIAGMTGTAESSAEEFELLYGLRIEAIKPHSPSRRIDNAMVVYRDNEAKWCAVADEILLSHKKRQPVLVGTSSIEESESLAARLKAAGIGDVAVLNAKNDEMEAEIIKNAGVLGAVTVSTNMAGRGIDIKLGGAAAANAAANADSYDEVVNAGGLLIIGTAMYENARMNQQLNGRAGRQGDVGETKLFVAIDDAIFLKHNLEKAVGRRKYAKLSQAKEAIITDKAAIKECQRIQRIAQGASLEERKRLLKFTMIGEKHRGIIFNKRLSYLEGECPNIWAAYAEDVFNEAVKRFGSEKVTQWERKAALSAINEVWCDYLEYTSELRTGIHLRAVGGRNPAEEYNIDCETYFEGIQEQLIDKVIDCLDDIMETGELDDLALFSPKNARTFLMDESGDELVRKPILLNVFNGEDEDDYEEESEEE